MNRFDRETIARTYPHRVDADPTSCPVCCGDGSTDDRRFGGKVVRQVGVGGFDRNIYACLACAVWHDIPEGTECAADECSKLATCRHYMDSLLAVCSRHSRGSASPDTFRTWYTAPGEPWAEEHGTGYVVPGILRQLVRDGIAEDMSWHNDACPSFEVRTRSGKRARLWVEHYAPEWREDPTAKRYELHTDGPNGFEILYSGDPFPLSWILPEPLNACPWCNDGTMVEVLTYGGRDSRTECDNANCKHIEGS